MVPTFFANLARHKPSVQRKLNFSYETTVSSSLRTPKQVRVDSRLLSQRLRLRILIVLLRPDSPRTAMIPASHNNLMSHRLSRDAITRAVLIAAYSREGSLKHWISDRTVTLPKPRRNIPACPESNLMRRIIRRQVKLPCHPKEARGLNTVSLPEAKQRKSRCTGRIRTTEVPHIMRTKFNVTAMVIQKHKPDLLAVTEGLTNRMPLFAKSCDYTKLKSNLRLCVNRMGLLQKKKTEMGMKARREVAELLKQNKIERSRIKTEHIVREDYVVEALEILQTYCELLLARFGIFEVSKEVDPCLEEAIASIIWCCPRLSSQVNELPVIREQFAGKYSKEYVEACLENKLRKVSQMVMQKLEIIQPPPSLVEMYMIEIAKAYGVEYEPNLDLLNSSTSDGGGGSGGAGASRNAENQLIDFEPDLLPCMPRMPDDFATGNSDKPWEHAVDPGPGAPYPQQSPFPGPTEVPPPCAPKGLSPDAQVGYYVYTVTTLWKLRRLLVAALSTDISEIHNDDWLLALSFRPMRARLDARHANGPIFWPIACGLGFLASTTRKVRFLKATTECPRSTETLSSVDVDQTDNAPSVYTASQPSIKPRQRESALIKALERVSNQIQQISESADITVIDRFFRFYVNNEDKTDQLIFVTSAYWLKRQLTNRKSHGTTITLSNNALMMSPRLVTKHLQSNCAAQRTNQRPSHGVVLNYMFDISVGFCRDFIATVTDIFRCVQFGRKPKSFSSSTLSLPMPLEGSTRAEVLPGRSRIDTSSRDAGFGFEPRTFRSAINQPLLQPMMQPCSPRKMRTLHCPRLVPSGRLIHRYQVRILLCRSHHVTQIQLQTKVATMTRISMNFEEDFNS
ncbi:IST1 homolog [Clonorchis sinensis]|uniref:IST1 homolog n=1 Tax=Clonorchis sinensis TaxID=79923 RepID=G7YUN3_CLOSI|nr:IST1 homolog [Clonorchis sinensis]